MVHIKPKKIANIFKYTQKMKSKIYLKLGGVFNIQKCTWNLEAYRYLHI